MMKAKARCKQQALRMFLMTWNLLLMLFAHAICACSNEVVHSTLKLLDPIQAAASNSTDKVSTHMKSKNIQYTLSENGPILLQDLRGQLQLHSKSSFAVIEESEGHKCVTPLSFFQETFTAFDESIVLLNAEIDHSENGEDGDDMHAVLSAYLYPPRQVVVWNMLQPEPIGDLKDVQDLYCTPWLSQVYLLSRLWEDRTVAQDYKDRVNVDEFAMEALEYFGFEARAKSGQGRGFPFMSVIQPLRMGKIGGSVVRRHFVNSVTPGISGDKVSLFLQLKELSRKCGEAFELFDIVPETYYANDKEDCKKIHEVVRDMSWMRKDGERHFAQGIQLVDKVVAGDCDFDDPERPTSILYQRKIDAFRVDGRVTMFRLYALVASFDPLVVFSDFNHGQFAIGVDDDTIRGEWNGQSTLQTQKDKWTMEKLDMYMAKEYNIDNFFATVVYPQYLKILTWSIEAAKDQFAGAGGHYDFVTQDLILSSDFKLYLLEMNSGCYIEGFGDDTPQRQFIMNQAMETMLEVQKAVLSDTSVFDSLEGDMHRSQNGFFNLIYSNQPGANFEHEWIASCADVSLEEDSDVRRHSSNFVGSAGDCKLGPKNNRQKISTSTEAESKIEVNDEQEDEQQSFQQLNLKQVTHEELK